MGKLREYIPSGFKELIILAQKKSKPISYADFGKKLGVFHRNVGRILGYIRDEILAPKGLPYLNALVVNKRTGYPGRAWLPGRNVDFSDRKEIARFKRELRKIYRYRSWDKVRMDNF